MCLTAAGEGPRRIPVGLIQTSDTTCLLTFKPPSFINVNNREYINMSRRALVGAGVLHRHFTLRTLGGMKVKRRTEQVELPLQDEPDRQESSCQKTDGESVFGVVISALSPSDRSHPSSSSRLSSAARFRHGAPINVSAFAHKSARQRQTGASQLFCLVCVS